MRSLTALSITFSLTVLLAALASPLPALAHSGDHNWTQTFKLINNYRNIRARCHPGSFVWIGQGTLDNIICTNHALSFTPLNYGSGTRINASDVGDDGCEKPNKVVIRLTRKTGTYDWRPNVAKWCE